jgi:hypothetical protein
VSEHLSVFAFVAVVVTAIAAFAFAVGYIDGKLLL